MIKAAVYTLFFVATTILVKAQNVYIVGTATKSIDPIQKPYSVSLSGFAAPKEGRFSLAWKKLETTNQVLFEQIRKSISTVKNTKIASHGGYYFINSKGELYSTKAASPKAKQYKISTEGKGKLISIASDDKVLYALNANDSIWKIDFTHTNNPWQLIGRNNQTTYNIHLHKITIVNNQFYGITEDNVVYKATHATDRSLSVSAMAIGYKGKKVLLIGVDLTGFSGTYINNIKKNISQKYKIPAAAILVNASHTHFAPVTAGWKTWEPFYQYPDSLYLNTTLKSAILKCVDEAITTMQPSSLQFSTGTTAIGINRRNTQKLIHPYDNRVEVLETVNLRTKEKNILFVTGCHPVFKNSGETAYTLSANYPGVCRYMLQMNNGYKNAVFLQGCGGDINPVSNDFTKTGTDLAHDINKIIASGMHPITNAPISFFIDEIKIPVQQWSRDSIQKFKDLNKARAGELEADKNVRWANLMLQPKGVPATSLTEIVQTINIGNIKLIGLSREVVNEYATAIRELWPQNNVWVAGYCNDVSSYLPNQWHIEEKLYEGYDSFFWYGQPALPPENVMDIVLQEIKKRNR